MTGQPQAVVDVRRAATSGIKAVEDRETSKAVALWLIVTAALVLAMVIVGGATRLTGSGLSITQWKPISGVLPPLSHRAWLEDFRLYQATPQYRLVNRGMDLPAFQAIFWWEWAHRFLGRLVGAVFAVPFLWFLVAGRLRGKLGWSCTILLMLGALQGLVGWWMVKSGLEDRITVAPERLATHLALALALFGGLLWTALDALAGTPIRRRDGWTAAGSVLAVAVFLQCLLGALVAGNQAGLVDNDWPLMAGRFFPDDYARDSLWATLAHGRSAVQFNHRMLAYVLAAFALGLGLSAVKATRAPPTLRLLALAVAGLCGLQVTLGVVTLLEGAPADLAIMHQAVAAALLGASVGLAWRAQRI
jgi:heme a synthase